MCATIHDDWSLTALYDAFVACADGMLVLRPFRQAEGLINENLLHDDPVCCRRTQPDRMRHPGDPHLSDLFVGGLDRPMPGKKEISGGSLREPEGIDRLPPTLQV